MSKLETIKSLLSYLPTRLTILTLAGWFLFAQIVDISDKHKGIIRTYGEWSLHFNAWQAMYVKRKEGTFNLQEKLQWDQVKRSWKVFEKTVDEEYAQR